MSHEILQAPGLRIEVDRRLLRLANRLASATGESTPYGLLVSTVEMYVQALAGKLGVPTGERIARIALDNLVDPMELELHPFWAGSLGRACAWWVGGHGAVVAAQSAAAALGCSRQNVFEMTQRGTLETADVPGLIVKQITAESLRDVLRTRFPLVVPRGHA